MPQETPGIAEYEFGQRDQMRHCLRAYLVPIVPGKLGTRYPGASRW
jgi:hypothetical protein